MGKEARPRNRAPIGDGMKVHLRVRRIGGRTLRLLTLRPGTDVRFSANYFHRTWHVVSSFAGGRLLAHLLWGLAFQRKPGTLFVLHGPHLSPTPFDADPSPPVVLVPRHLGAFDDAMGRALRRALPRLGPPDRTVRWQSHGLKAAHEAPWDPRWKVRRDERAQHLGGCVCVGAGPTALRELATEVARMRTGGEGRSDWRSFGPEADFRFFPEGEVQLFDEYDRMVSVAREARRRVLTDPVDPRRDGAEAEQLRLRVWREVPAVVAKRGWKDLREHARRTVDAD